MNNLSERENLFKNDIDVFTDYDQKLRDQFFNYWSEPNKSKTKMRWEMEKTWDIKRRLKTFYDNQQKWHNGTGGSKNQSGALELLEQIRSDSRNNK